MRSLYARPTMCFGFGPALPVARALRRARRLAVWLVARARAESHPLDEPGQDHRSGSVVGWASSRSCCVLSTSSWERSTSASRTLSSTLRDGNSNKAKMPTIGDSTRDNRSQLRARRPLFSATAPTTAHPITQNGTTTRKSTITLALIATRGVNDMQLILCIESGESGAGAGLCPVAPSSCGHAERTALA